MKETRALETEGSPMGAPDDFTLINGIGSGIERRLHSAGVFTFRQLGSMSPSAIIDAIGSLVGLTPDRILRQDWIGQAQSLALAAPSEPLETVLAVPEEEPDKPADRQHYQMFTVEILLDEADDIRRTRVVHVGSKRESTWAGWDAERIIQSMGDLAGLNLPGPAAQPIPVTVEESVESLQKPTPQEHRHPDWVDKTRFQLSKAVTRSIHTEQPGSLFLQDRKVHAQFLLDLADSMKTPEKQFAYHADVFIHRLDDPGKWWLKSIHGQLPGREPVLVEFDTEELLPGTYMIDTRVLVREGEETASVPVDGVEEAAGTIHSNIFWVYG